MEQMKRNDELWKQAIMCALPSNLKEIINKIPLNIQTGLEEIRIRECRPLMIYSYGKDYFICKDGNVSTQTDNAYWVTSQDTYKILQLISNYSIYALEEELRNGYITLLGGYRVGFTGKAILEGGKLKAIKHINSFNFRISKEIFGAANKALPFIVKDNNVLHTLILSPPQMGKTTLLRDISRQLSDGFPGFKGLKVGIIDERSEIAGCFQGIPQNHVGLRTDILDACPKASGIMMLIRSMSPNVIVTDEIGRAEDAEAIQEALNAGIKVITTAHAQDIQDALQRPILSQLINKKVFERILVLGNSLGVGSMEKVYNAHNFNNLLEKPLR